jgi:hypothetical protein
MTVLTIATVAGDLGADLGHWPADVLIPVIAGQPQAQGDLLVLPADGFAPPAVRPLPSAGEVVLTGRGGNAHCLAAGTGDVCWAPVTGRQTLGTLTVAAGGVAYLFHAPEHGPRMLAEHEPLAIGGGTYVIRRQREQRDEIALVAD